MWIDSWLYPTCPIGPTPTPPKVKAEGENLTLPCDANSLVQENVAVNENEDDNGDGMNKKIN